MKSLPLFNFAFVALSASIVIAKPVENLHETTNSSEALRSRQQNINWAFVGYQNQQCTGEDDIKSGLGSRDCQTGMFLNGGILGYLKTFIDDECVVAFFEDENCRDLAGLIDEDSDNTCTRFGGAGYAQSYDVTCPDD